MAEINAETRNRFDRFRQSAERLRWRPRLLRAPQAARGGTLFGQIIAPWSAQLSRLRL